MSSPRSEFLAGIKAISPILLGVIPFAVISGIAAVDVGLPPALAVFMSFFVFAGAAQLAAVQLIGVSASVIVIVLTAIIINLRFVMYSASLAPHLKPLTTRWKHFLAYLLTDQAYAVSITNFNDHPTRANKHWFYLGAAGVMWVAWQGCTMFGVFLGTQVPKSWSLDFAVPLTFLALVIPAIKDRAAIAAAISASVMALVAVNFPFNLGLIFAAASGILVGVAVELWLQKREK